MTTQQQQPVTHTVDLRTMTDPVNTADNALMQQMQQLLGTKEIQQNTSTVREAKIVPTTPPTGADAYEQQLAQQPESYDQLDLSDPTVEDNSELLEGFLTPTQQETPQQQEPGDDPEYNAFASQFEKYLGVKLPDAVATFNELQQFRTEQALDRQLNEVSQAWGVERTEAEARLSAVRERFGKLDKTTQNMLAQDQVKATQLIWSQLEREQQRAAQRVPQLDRSSQVARSNVQPSGILYRSQLDALSEKDYVANLPYITQQYSAGKVINDITK